MSPATVQLNIELTPQEARVLVFAAELMLDMTHRQQVKSETIIASADKLRYALIENGEQL